MGAAREAGFTEEQIARAHAFHAPLYRLFLLRRALSLAVLALLAFSGLGTRLFDALAELGWPADGLATPAAITGLLAVVGLPFAYWRGFVHEHRFGLSTQTRLSWAIDWAKSLVVSLVIGVAALFGLLVLIREVGGWWPAVAAPAAFALVIALTFVGPVLTEPLFNRFEPLGDVRLAEELRALSTRAGVPVRKVLVADASRRTRRQNAYVSGLGATRRVVLYDTLVTESPPASVRLVTAHELAHRREHHVALGSVIGAASAAGFVLLLWGLLGSQAVLSAIGATSAADPRITPFVLLVARALGLVLAPLGSALSRRWERAADRISIELTHDLAAFESVHRELAVSNLSDLEPPRAFYLVAFSHPSAPERVLAARETAAALAAQPAGAAPATR